MADRVTGVLLVGGASRRFGSPKALARIGEELLAERAHATLVEAFGRVLVVGKEGDELPLPFPVVDDGHEIRAPIVGVAAGLRHADTDVAVFLPTDVPWMTPNGLRALAEAAVRVDAAVSQTGPLPGAYRQSALPALERHIEKGDLALRGVLKELDTRVVQLDEAELRNVNTPDDLTRET